MPDGSADDVAEGADSLGNKIEAGADGSAGDGSGGTLEVDGPLEPAVLGGTATGAVLDADRGPDVRSG